MLNREVESKIREHTASLEQNTQKVLDITQPLPYGKFAFPSDWTPVLPFDIRRDIDGTVRHNMNFSKFTNGGVIHYVDTDNGLDTNDSLTKATSVKTLGKAIQIALSGASGLHQIKINGFVAKGEAMLNSTNNIWNIPSDKIISIMSETEDKKVYITTGKKIGSYSNWIVDSGIYKLNVIDEEFTAVYDNVDLDVYGIPKPLKRALTLAECKTTPNSFYAIPVAKGGGLWINYKFKKNLFNPSTVKLNTRLISGVETSDATAIQYNIVTSDFKKVTPNSTVIMTPAMNNARNLVWYDINKNYITEDYPSDSVNGYPRVLKVPSNAHYVRLQIYPQNTPDWRTSIVFTENGFNELMPISGEILSSTNKPLGSNLVFNIADGGKLYTQDIIFLSGDISNETVLSALSSNGGLPGALSIIGNSSNSDYWGKDCVFIGGQTGGIDSNGFYNGLYALIGGLTTRKMSSYTFNCIGAYNKADAFSYGGIMSSDKVATRKYIAFEYQNIAYETDGDDKSNSSTTHYGMSRLNVGCIYGKTGGGVILDAYGGYSIIIDCIGSDANYNRATPNPSVTGSIFGADLSDADYNNRGYGGKLILINCSAYGKGYSSAYTRGNIEMYLLHFKTNKQIVASIPAQMYQV